MVKKCYVCDGSVYAMEEFNVDGKCLHKTCFKCDHCKRGLTISNFAAVNGKFFCKTHYMELFKSSGGSYAAFGDGGFKKKATGSMTAAQLDKVLSSPATSDGGGGGGGPQFGSSRAAEAGPSESVADRIKRLNKKASTLPSPVRSSAAAKASSGSGASPSIKERMAALQAKNKTIDFGKMATAPSPKKGADDAQIARAPSSSVEAVLDRPRISASRRSNSSLRKVVSQRGSPVMKIKAEMKEKQKETGPSKLAAFLTKTPEKSVAAKVETDAEKKAPASKLAAFLKRDVVAAAQKDAGDAAKQAAKERAKKEADARAKKEAEDKARAKKEAEDKAKNSASESAEKASAEDKARAKNSAPESAEKSSASDKDKAKKGASKLSSFIASSADETSAKKTPIEETTSPAPQGVNKLRRFWPRLRLCKRSSGAR